MEKLTYFLTPYSDVEKKHSRRLFSAQKFLQEHVRESCPGLYAYCQSISNLELRMDRNHWIIDYFTEYTRSKILGQRSNKLTKYINDKNDGRTQFYGCAYRA